MECHCMRGFLMYLILWVLHKGSMTGAEIAGELEKRKGKKPSPGTIYPALKEMNEKGLISRDKQKKYSLTKEGEKEMKSACSQFCRVFHDMTEMHDCCREKHKH